MDSVRFFVTNLPINTKDADLQHIFQDCGDVKRVDIKMKEDQVDPGNGKVIAFVTIKVNRTDIERCLRTLNNQRVNGGKIKVSLAKESFLERLKREREEKESKNEIAQQNEHDSQLLIRSSENNHKIFAEDDMEDGNIDSELLITKKRASNSLQNGKIIIQSYDSTPVHVIQTKKFTKSTHHKCSVADQKRKKSINDMKMLYQKKKSTIQRALAAWDSKPATKIILDSTLEHIDEMQQNFKAKKNLFSDSDDHDDMRDPEVQGIQIKPEHFGKKGEILLHMQRNQSLDPRFKIGENFVDDDDDFAYTTQNKADMDSEKNWQMNILEQVVGTKDATTGVPENFNVKKKMLRFDPSKIEHKKMLREKKDYVDYTKEKETTKQTTEAEKETEVSKEVFYTITESLTESLKTSGSDFSLINLFGKSQDIDQNDDLKKATTAIILINRKEKTALVNPFRYDSSSGDEEDTQMKNQVNISKENLSSFKRPLVKIPFERFFIPKNDIRLKEGAKFYKLDENDHSVKNYDEVRNRLKLLIKTKIVKTRKNLNKKS